MEKAIFRTLCLGFLLATTSVFSQGGSTLSGEVLYHDNYPMSSVYVYLHDANGNIIATDLTDQDGQYEFSNLSAGDYTVTFDTDQPAGGVELDDANLVLQYLNGEVTFTPLQELAADVNGSGNITHGDYQLILNRYLGRGKGFPVGNWVFEPLSVTIPTESRDGFTTKGGSSSGDVNGTLVPDPKSNTIFLTDPAIYLVQDPQESIEFNLTAGQNLRLAGMHMILKVPEELEVTGVESTVPIADIYLAENNQIRVTWLDESEKGYNFDEGTSLLTIRTKAKDYFAGEKSYHLSISDGSHLMDANGNIMNGVSLSLPTITLQPRREMQVSVYPNPFIGNATVEHQLPEDGKVVVSLFDQTGRKIAEVENGFKAAGVNQAKINGADLTPGIYHYTFEYAGNTENAYSGTIIKSK